MSEGLDHLSASEPARKASWLRAELQERFDRLAADYADLKAEFETDLHRARQDNGLLQERIEGLERDLAEAKQANATLRETVAHLNEAHRELTADKVALQSRLHTQAEEFARQTVERLRVCPDPKASAAMAQEMVELRRKLHVEVFERETLRLKLQPTERALRALAEVFGYDESAAAALAHEIASREVPLV